MSEAESPALLRARHFSALCDLDEAGRAAGLAALAAHDPALAAEVARMLALDAEEQGPIEELRGEVADAAGRQLLSGELGDEPGHAPPERLGAWKLGPRLGAGGMGEVWSAERVEGGFTQRAAVKLVRSGVSSLEIAARFRRERQVLARLQHPAIARLLDGGVAPDGRPWFAMERVDGEPITVYARSRGLALAARLRLVIEVARAVDAAHRSLVVHRDLKPSNILVTNSGEPKLLDFGLAKLLEPENDPQLTRSDVRALTPAYAAPEQIYGEAVTVATDVYALGVLLYELVTGELPHARRSPTPEGLADEISRETIERPSSRVRRTSGLTTAEGGGGAVMVIAGLSRARLAHRLKGDLDTIALTALKREPERRYGTVAAFADDLERFLAGRPVSARPDTLGYRTKKFVSRHRVAVAAALLVALALAVGAAAALWQARATRIESERTARVRDFLASIFGSLDPDLGPGRDASAATLLADGAARVEAELATEPRIAAELYAALSRAWLALDRYDEAERLAQRSLDLARASAGDDSILAATSQALVGEIATAREDLPAGERELRGALARLARLKDGAGGRPGLAVARAAAALGRNLNAQRRHAEALALSEGAYVVLARELGPGDREAVRALLAASQALRFSDRAAEAAGRIAGARELLERSPAVNPVTRALLDVERAHVELHLRHPATALAAAEAALASLAETLGPESAARASALQARALARMQGGDFGGAQSDLDAAIAVLRALDPDHPRLASVQIDFALVLEHRGRIDDGIALRREVLESSLRRAGPESAEVRNQRALLGAVLRTAQRYPEAEIELREAIRLEQSSAERAGEHAVSAARIDLGNLLLATGRPGEAVALLRQRLERMLALGSSAPRYELTVTRLHLAQALLAVGDGPSLAEARRVATEVAEAEARIAPGEERSPHEVLPAFVLARVDLAEGNLADARRGFEEALALWQRAGRGSSAASGEAHLLLGETLLRLGERTAAEAELRAAYELLFRRSGANHADTLRAKARLDELKSGPGTGRQPAAQLPPAGRR
ncbi:MAG: serine/threonine protein kinase [Thermoanaerobaculia bacterium]|jgi:serine/threonine-protein kinase|nr:serine/threonine protein kinase [Thermoanaerobaculia bacterium]MBP9822772.1 serine/threonine protein kinase [Thermoanaerobaculia bacterium]